MDSNTILLKRILLFLFGCMTVRLGLVYIAKTIPVKYLPYMGYLFLLPALGVAYIYVTGIRRTGAEVFGNRIWWNNLRPVHSLLYFTFAYLAITSSKIAYIPLLIDTSIGFIGFMVYHLYNNNFKKLL